MNEPLAHSLVLSLHDGCIDVLIARHFCGISKDLILWGDASMPKMGI